MSALIAIRCNGGREKATFIAARRGYPVVALDFSEHIFDRARANVTASGLAHMVKFEHGSLLNLRLPDSSFDFVLCWGVLMHIPEVEKAISELARVVRPNGILIVSEDNMWSLESVLTRIARRVLGSVGIKRLKGKDFARLTISTSGVEYWRHPTQGRSSAERHVFPGS